MPIPDLEAMDFEALWRLHEELTKILAEKIMNEKLELEKRLAQLHMGEADNPLPDTVIAAAPTRSYPKVLPKYRDPATDETWSGRGKRPRWLVKALASGHKLEEFRIDETEAASLATRRR